MLIRLLQQGKSAPGEQLLSYRVVFVGNNMEVLFGYDKPFIDIMHRQFITTVLYQHTSHMAQPTIEQQNWWLEVLKLHYVEV